MTATADGTTQDQVSMEEKRRVLKEEYTAAKGFWPEMHDAMLELDPDFLRAFMEYGRATTAKEALTPKVREFVYIAIDGCTTHLYNPGTKNHLRQALKLGATNEEILEILQIISLVGVHSTSEGVPLLLEVLKEQGIELPQDEALEEKRRVLKEEYTAAKGFWPEMHNAMLLLDPDFLRAVMEYGKATTAKEALSPKLRELLYIAIDGCTTHLYNPGTINHIRQALKLGATINEILEVLQIITLVGAHSTSEGVPLLLEVLNEQKDA